MTHTLRVLTSDVPNPRHDKRKTRRLEGIATFRAGTQFVLRPSTEGNPAVLDLFDVGPGLDQIWGWINRDLEAAFLENSTVLPAMDWKGIAATVRSQAVGNLWAAEVIDQLLRDHVVTPEQVAAALHASMEG